MRTFVGVSLGMLLAGAATASAQTIQLPQITVTAPSPIQRSPAPDNAAGPLQGTLPIVTDQFATITVVPGSEIQRSTGGTIGEVLQSKPGITSSNFAPGAASRPIVRGLDNYRVRIQENGLATNDVSEIGEDHGVAIDPLAARQIEVIRGPATLRYGSQAIGGVVNADNNRIPTSIPQRGFAAEMKGAFNSVDTGREGAILLDAGKDNFAFHADAFGRGAEDYRIPGYPYLFPPDPAPLVGGRQPNSSMHADGQSVGGSYIFNGGFVGVAVSRFASFYRVPGIEAAETGTRIDLNQTKITSKGEFRPQSSAVDIVRFWLGSTDYKHQELANENGFDGVQQTFTNRAQEGRVEIQLTPFDLRFASLTNALGTQGSLQRLTAPGFAGDANGLFDPNRTTSIAAYMFNELKFNDAFKMQVAGRIEHVHVDGSVPDLFADPNAIILRNRDFTPKSGAIGFLHNLPWDLVASLTGQYVERAPRAPELLSRGVHEATGTFDIGNPNLNTEIANSVEVGLRRAKAPWRFEATAYYTKFTGFIFRRLTGQTCDDDFATCTPAGTGTELNQAIYTQRDALFRGGEFQAQFDLVPVGGGMFGIDGQYDIVRATFSDGSNVPRIPPQRYGGGAFWRSENWFARVGLLHADAQTDVAPNETTTAGYNLLKAAISYSGNLKGTAGSTEITLGLTGDNLLNEDVRNAVSFKKDEVLLPGRTVRAFASLRF